MDHVENERANRAESANGPGLRWRPWPCEGCRGRTTALDFLVGCFGTSPQIPEGSRNEVIDAFRKWEAERLLEWVDRCPHTEWVVLSLPKLDEGSEHLVLVDVGKSEVVKITLPGTYGDYYEIAEGRMSQYACTPVEYLLRLRWWDEHFTTAPEPLGMSDSGQIVSRQRLIQGDLPEQGEVDAFLVEAGLTAVRQSSWLWKRAVTESAIEVWIGDARADNFVSTTGGIVPIDIRIWGVPIPRTER